MMKTLNLFFKIGVISLVMSACVSKNGNYDAAGTFEATEIIVSSEANGKIMVFDIQEGQDLKAGQKVGYIDSLQLFLRKKQILTSIRATESRRPEIHKQIAVIEQQIVTQRIEKERIEKLLVANAANQKQLDDINAQISLLQKQSDAQKSSLAVTTNGISEDAAALSVQVEQLIDQLKKCQIINPISGVVLAKYTEPNELATMGKPLYKIADIKNMILRAYITSDQLSQIRINQQVKVFVDFGKNGIKEYTGTIAWVSSKSEFTPKTIQTKDERANSVYAVKISVPNDGYLKIGMYGEIKIVK